MRRVICGKQQRETSVRSVHRAENVFVGSRRKLTRSGPNPARKTCVKGNERSWLSKKLTRQAGWNRVFYVPCITCVVHGIFL